MLGVTKEGIHEDKQPAKYWWTHAEHKRDAAGANTLFKLLGKLAENPNAKSLAGGPVKMPDDYKLWLFGAVLIFGLCVGIISLTLFFASWKNENFPDQTIITTSGPMPMGGVFEVEPITTYTLPDSVQDFDLVLGEKQEKYECNGSLTFRVDTQGTMIIDNFTGVNITVQTPARFPDVVTITCPRPGRLGFSQSDLISAPTLAAPTTAPTKQAPVVEEPAVAPTATIEMFYASWVIYANEPQTPVWNNIQTESLEYYVYVLSAQPCQTPITLPAGYPSMQALVKINSSTYHADVVVANNTVTVMCTGTFDLVSLP